MPTDVVEILDHLDACAADDRHLTTKEAMNGVLAIFAEAKGLPYTPSTPSSVPAPIALTESNAQFDSDLRTVVREAFEEQSRSITRVQDRTLEVSQRLDLWQRQSIPLAERMAASAKGITEHSGYIQNAAIFAAKAIADARQISQEAHESAEHVKAQVSLVLLGSVLIIVLEFVIGFSI